MSAALVCQRLRRCRPARAWLDRHRRNDRRIGHRDFSDPRNVLCHRATFRWPKGGGGDTKNGIGEITAACGAQLKRFMIENLPTPIAVKSRPKTAATRICSTNA